MYSYSPNLSKFYLQVFKGLLGTTISVMLILFVFALPGLLGIIGTHLRIKLLDLKGLLEDRRRNRNFYQLPVSEQQQVLLVRLAVDPHLDLEDQKTFKGLLELFRDGKIPTSYELLCFREEHPKAGNNNPKIEGPKEELPLKTRKRTRRKRGNRKSQNSSSL